MMRSLLRLAGILGLFLAMGAGYAAGADVSFAASGSLTWDLSTIDPALDTTWSATFTSGDSMLAQLDLHSTASGPDRFDLIATALLGEIELKSAGSVDLQTPSFTSGMLSADLGLDQATVCGEARLQRVGDGIGLGVELDLEVQEASIPLRSAAVGFNLDAFGRVQTASCGLLFSYASVSFDVRCNDCAQATATATFEPHGLTEILLSAGNVGTLAMSVQFAALLIYELDDKSARVSPSFLLETPDCFDLYAGLTWDASANRIEDIRIYGLGVHCEVKSVRVRGLWSLAPGEISLVKAPYDALLGLVWPVPGCCETTGEASVAFFFGNGGLLDLGEFDAELVLPVSDTSTVWLGLAMPAYSPTVLTVGWDLAF